MATHGTNTDSEFVKAQQNKYFLGCDPDIVCTLVKLKLTNGTWYLAHRDKIWIKVSKFLRESWQLDI